MHKALHVGLSVFLVVSTFAHPADAKDPKDPETAAAAAEIGAGHRAGLENFDARLDPETLAVNGAAVVASKAGGSRDVTGALDALRAKAPASSVDAVRVDLHGTGTPKSIFNDEGVLTDARSGSPDAIGRAFLAENRALFGLSRRDVRSLELTLEDADAVSGVTHLRYQQVVRGLPVYDGEIGLTITPRGEILIANAGQLVDAAKAPTAASLSDEEGIARAFELCGAPVAPESILLAAAKSADVTAFAYYTNPLGESRHDVIFQKTLVNVHGEATLAFRVYVDKNDEEWYEALVDANTGDLIARYNIVSDAQGTVYTSNPTRAARSVQQFSPLFGVGDAWLAGTVSTGNNVDAYLDRDANNGPDADNTTGMSSGRASAPSGDFTFTFATGANPRNYKPAVVTNLFYFNNYMHDWMYSLGFTESSRNFQTNNYGRGGSQNDPVNAEAQDGSGTNNANFATPPDGSRPRMQQYLFTMGTSSQTDDRDSSVDGDVVLHEYGHGVSNRLIGNGSTALQGTQSGAMGEGWGDYWACSSYNDGVMGEYVTNNTTRGIRRAAYTVPAATVHDSYADVGSGGFEVHDDGEVWAAALWDLFNTLGKTKTDRLVLEGMKNTVTRPSFLNARDGILAADQALYAGADKCQIWTVFARHGMGYSASGNDGTTHNAATNLPAECGGSQSCSSSTTAISSGQSLSGSLATTDCASTVRTGNTYFYDNFTIAATAGTTYTITLTSSAFDTYLYLLNGSTVVASDDDGNGGTNSRIVYTATSSGTLTVHCTSYSAAATGSYTVAVTSSGGGGGTCGGTSYSGSLSGTGATAYQPNGTYYQSTVSGTHTAALAGPSGTDFDLYLQKWNGASWVSVASSTGATSTENVSYNGTSGYYRWRIYAYSGGGSYTLCTTRP